MSSRHRAQRDKDMSASDQSRTPQPPHVVGALTTSELAAYRRQLERAIQDRTIGSAPIANDLRDKLAEVAREESDRERHKNSGQRWPLNN
jgi:hypothetical protein